MATTEAVQELMRSHSGWYHQIELAPGVVTPGVHQSWRGLEYLDELGLPSDCRGKRVLDIGTMDGFYAFEMERRGADVVAIDYMAAENTGFSIVHDLFGSKVEHRLANVYDLAVDTFGRFDIVLFLGVLYHLRNPMLALDTIRGIMADGAELFVETQLAVSESLIDSDVPALQYFPGDSHNRSGTNKFGPNLAGLGAMLEDCELAVARTVRYGDRGYAHARAVSDTKAGYFRDLDASAGLRTT